MRMIFPEDISERIAQFIDGEQHFPFIKRNELICIFFLYGNHNKVEEPKEIQEALDLAERTVDKMSRDIEVYNYTSKAKMNSEYIRAKYINRGLQIRIEKKREVIKEQMPSDPTIMCDCFAQHVSFYDQDYFFQVYGPLRESEVIKSLEKRLLSRMVMLGFNRKSESCLPFKHPLIPVYIWLRQ